MVSIVAAVVLLLASSGICSGQRKLSRTQAITTEVKTGVNFDCPEEFGYYPHPTDCTQYYVCVFGGALLESCTGGLMYSHELQTCDWPRNVGCDAGADVTVTATAAPSNPSRSSESRVRYTPPPPPQPAAVVTSRGQPRNLQQNHQEIIKVSSKSQARNVFKLTTQQQQQLYEDTEEALPPAEEVENDRQQRVYRGQPSTIGQVQRDRDGLRHSNAIPNYNGRSEKIGVISFGTQQQSQPIQQYSGVTDNDGTLINDLIQEKRKRRKRQILRRPSTLDPWHGSTHKLQHGHNPFQHKPLPFPVFPPYKRPANGNYQYFSSYFARPDSHTTEQYKYVMRFEPVTTAPTLNEIKPHFLSPPKTFVKAKPVQFSSTTTTPKPTTLSEDYYYYEDEITEKPLVNTTQNSAVDDEYYYDDYDYPDNTSLKNLVETVKYSARYNEKLQNPMIAKIVTLPPLTTPTTKNTRHTHKTTSRPATTLRQTTDLRQYRNTSTRVEVTSVGPSQQPSVATATARTLYNGSQHYDPTNYDPYYSLYEDDVELYRDIDYTQHYNNGQSQQTYRGTPATVLRASPTPTETKRGNVAYIQNSYTTQDVYQQPDYNEDNNYNSQADEQTNYRQSNRQPSRGDRNELNYVEEVATTKRTTTTKTTTTTPIPTQKSTIPSRTNTRGRGSAHFSSNNGISNSNSNLEVVNRGTPPSRSRPTLKPSTSIISKASEYIDIYRYPPRRPDPIYPTPQADKTAAKCRKDVCLLPDCSCGGKEIPGDLPVEQVPQIVLLTFDDSVNDLNKGLYSDLFEKGRVNPNGCPIAATFYVSHEWTDYSQVQNLYSDGHELASHTVSHSFGEQFSQKKWTREVAGQREILSAYGGVKLEDVRGMRAPFLSVGGNKMFKMLYDSNFTYDSSMPIYENKPPSWPYTLDYKLFHDCMIPPCPTRSYPGVWEVPMVMWQDLNGGRCSMGDACSNPGEADGVYKMLMKNFERHYTTNRAPFGLFYHAAWFTQPHHKEGFINFLDTINQMKDVFLVTNWQAIQWVRDPTPLSKINSFQPFQCNYSDRPKRCNNPKVCNLWHKSGVRYMRTCQPCPDIYPWTGNTGIRSSRIDNDIED